MGGPRALLAPAVSGLLLAAAGALRVAGDLPNDHLVAEILPNAVLALVLPLLGSAVLVQLPGHLLGRLWVATGVAGAVTLAVHSYAEVATAPGSGLPLAVPAAWVSSWVWVLGSTPLLTVGLLLFPDGRLPSRRWRALLAVDALAVVLPVLGQALAPGRLEELAVDNPLGVTALAGACAVLRSVGFLCFTVGAVGGALGLVLRWRQGSADDRRRLALPALVAALLGATFLVPTTDTLVPWLDAIAVAEVTLLLAAFGVAVLRDRITGAQVVVRRSLTYGLLTGALAVTYTAAVTSLSALLGGRGSDLLATLVVALLALPLRDRLQRVVDRALYGERADPFAALDHLGRRLDSSADSGAVLQGVAESVATILRLPSVQVVVRGAADAEVLAAAVGVETTSWTRLPLQHQGQDVGALLVAPRAGQLALDPRDVRMLEALRRQAAAAVASVRLSGELQRSRQRLVAAREEERRRLRRDLHDGLGPTLAGIGLGLDIAHTSSDPEQVERLLLDLKQAAAAAVVDVRRLVEDLRPPALDELGLMGALRRHADRLNLGGVTHVEVTASMPLEGLPAAVEVAAYRIVMEALTNAVKHARPRTCRVQLRVDDALHVEVSDDGSGLADDAREGVGLGAMRERAAELGGTCEVRRREAGGTVVLATLPLGPS